MNEKLGQPQNLYFNDSKRPLMICKTISKNEDNIKN